MITRRRFFQIGAVVAWALVLWIGIGVIVLPRVDPLPFPPPTVVIALSAGVVSDTLVDAGITRLSTAIALARQLGARLMTTRVFGAGGESSDAAQRRMIAPAGLADRWTILSQLVDNTHDEALALKAQLADSTRIAVVTSPLHTRRACAIFEHVGFRVTCIASRQYKWWLVVHGFVYEQLAFVKAWHNGWV